MKILIAEDDAASRGLLAAFLLKRGYDVTAAADGLKAWETLRAGGPFDLALLDWNMPGMDGVELCRRIKAERKDLYTYVIVLTSKNSTPEIVEAFEAGADDYISKPPEMAVLCARVGAGLRVVALQNKLGEYARDMESLATERAAQLARADRLVTIGLLSAGVAHEINNPASNISVNLQTISKNWPVVSGYLEGLPAPSAEGERARAVLAEMPHMVREMQNGVVRIKKITDGLKAYARPGNGLKKAVDVNRCAEEALKLCGGRLGKKISVVRELAAELPGVAADEGQVEQVLINLLINAADAIESRERGEITLRTASEAGSVIIRVRDDGPGIPEEAMRKIFKAFFTTKETGKGTGLGLFISQSIIEGSGGAISAKNHPGGGAEFTVKLPAILNGGAQ
jgi:signal transduction histidine kinase